MLVRSENSDQVTTLEWLVEGRILLMDVKVNVLESSSKYDQLIVNHMNSTLHEVDIIMCMPEFRVQKPLSLKQLANFKYQRHPRLGYVIFIGQKTNQVVRFFMTTVASVRGLRMHTFETLNEAMAFLRQARGYSA